MNNLEILETPVALPCGLKLPNRLVKGPMAEGLATKPGRKYPNDLHSAVYRTWGEGGYGMLVTGNVQIDARYLGGPGDITFEPTDLTNPVALSQWKMWATACQASGTPTVVQICHPGRQSPIGTGNRSLFAKTLSSSATALNLPGGWFTKLAQKLIFGTPKEMTLEDIDEVVNLFVGSAKMSFKAGFKGVQLHAAHGYLMTQFLSPKINTRTDEYGGTPEKRLKFILRIIAETRAATSKEFCIGAKLNSADFQSMGVSEEEVLAQVSALSSAGIDFIDISGGTYEDPKMAESREKPLRESTRLREAYFSDFAAKARKAAPETVIMVTGGFRTRTGMAVAVKENACDLVGIARPTCIEPALPKEKILNQEVLDEDAVVESITIKGGAFFRSIPLIGLGTESVWHGAQIRRIAMGKKPDPNLSII